MGAVKVRFAQVLLRPRGVSAKEGCPTSGTLLAISHLCCPGAVGKPKVSPGIRGHLGSSELCGTASGEAENIRSYTHAYIRLDLYRWFYSPEVQQILM